MNALLRKAVKRAQAQSQPKKTEQKSVDPIDLLVEEASGAEDPKARAAALREVLRLVRPND